VSAPPEAPPAPPSPGGFETSLAPKVTDDPEKVAPTEIERFATAFASSAPAVEARPDAFAQAPAHAPADSGPARTAPAEPARRPEAPEQREALAPTPAAGAPAGRFSPSAGVPEGLPEAERLKHERARRLARVLASDIAIYNKEKRDRGIKDGNLVAVLGYEIKKSWEVYKERVTPEMANATPYFRDALNEMLAEGKKVF
jgi:hypothetical protein